MSYTSLEIWQLAREVVIQIHEMTLTQIHKFEMYEVGSQIRKSSKSIKSNIVEGYGRRFYKQEFIHFLYIAKASADETKDHLDILYDTKSLTNREIYENLSRKMDKLNRQLYHFIETVKTNHNRLYPEK
ncbi:MAG: four helix bundle protein [bacterium]